MRGFIQIPLLIAFLVGAIAFGGGGYYLATKTNHPSQEQAAAASLSDTDQIATSSQPATSTNTVPVESAPASKQTTQPKERNIANTVADYYETNAIFIGKDLEILNDFSSDIDRYIQGIPRVVSNFKNMVSIAFSSGDTSQADDYLDDWGAGYIRDFKNLKLTVSNTYQKFQSQQNLLLEISRNLRSKYIPASEWDSYADEIDSYHNQNKGWLAEIAQAHDNLTSRFIQDKDNTNETIYQAGTDSIKKQSATLPSYRPLPTSAPSYSLPIRTFCNSGGGLTMCTTYGF